jgi:hypothetical protein
MIFTFDLGQDDRLLLRKFFKQLRSGFRGVIEGGLWANRVTMRFPGNGRRHLFDALQEAEDEWVRIEAAIDEVGDATLLRFGMFGRFLRAKF